MTSKITFSGIVFSDSIIPTKITAESLKYGRIPAGKATNKMDKGNKIDILVSKKEYSVNGSVEFDENDIKKRETYRYEDISESSFKKQRLALGTEFFKGIEDTDIIYLILH